MLDSVRFPISTVQQDPLQALLLAPSLKTGITGQELARLEPYRATEIDDDAAAADLIRRGIADPPDSPCGIDELAAMPSPDLPEGVSASRLIVAER